MRPLGLVLGLILLWSGASLQAAPTGVNATGGGITSVNLSNVHSSDQWFVFYGNSNSTSISSQILSLNASLLNDSSDTTRLLTLGSTYNLYLISDSSAPLSGPFSTPDLAAFDLRYNLSGPQSVRAFFNENRSYDLLTLNGLPNGTLPLPTIYLPGYSYNGASDPTAYYEGLAQMGTAYVFIVPVSPHLGFDHRAYDFEFVLPFSYAHGTDHFQVFFIAPPAPPPAISGIPAIAPPGYRWSYDGATLYLQTVAGASVLLQDERGLVYHLVADEHGRVQLLLLSGPYTLRIEVSGAPPAENTLYLQPPSILPFPPVVPPNESSTGPGRLVVMAQTPQGAQICIGADCYLSPDRSVSSLQKLTELSCSGSLCRFVGDNQTAFVAKYHLQTSHLLVPPRSDAYAPAPNPDFVSAFSQLGAILSAQWGSSDRSPDPWLFILTLILLSTVAMVLTRRPLPPTHKKRGGYD